MMWELKKCKHFGKSVKWAKIYICKKASAPLEEIILRTPKGNYHSTVIVRAVKGKWGVGEILSINSL